MLPPPFHVLATANPVEYEGTYPLPEAQLDRFLLRVVRLPDAEEECDVLRRRMARQREEPTSRRSPTRRRCSRCRRPWNWSRSTRASAAYCVALAPRPARTATCWWARRRAASLALMLLGAGQGRDRRAATSSSPRT